MYSFYASFIFEFIALALGYSWFTFRVYDYPDFPAEALNKKTIWKITVHVEKKNISAMLLKIAQAYDFICVILNIRRTYEPCSKDCR